VTARTRDDDLKDVPLWKANKEAWPPGVRSVGIEEIDCLGVDRRGNLYWDGKAVEVRRLLLTRKQALWGIVVGVFAIVGAFGAAAQGWAAYNDWACRAGWPAVVCARTAR
jgi:hypothetical protein